MIAKFDELQKRCKRYYFKRRILPILLAALVVLAAGGYLWYGQLQKNPTHLVQKSPQMHASQTVPVQKTPPPKHAAPPKQAAMTKESNSTQNPMPKKRCVALQLLYSFDTNMEQIFKVKYKAMRLGLHCRIQYGKLLDDGRKQVFLICNTASKKSALKPYIKVLKRAHMDYTIINDACRYKRAYRKPRAQTADNVEKKVQEQPVEEASVVEAPAPQMEQNLPTHPSGLVQAEPVSMQELKKLYKERKSYDLALKIARLAYDKGAYKEALAWAKRANKLDRTKEGAWIVYAKSLYALGKHRQAKELLRVYLDYRDSQQAKKLLGEWQ